MSWLLEKVIGCLNKKIYVAVEDKVKQTEIFSSSFDFKFGLQKRRDTMPKITSTTNEEPAHDDLKYPSNKSKQRVGNLKKGSKKSFPRKSNMDAVKEACHKNIIRKGRKDMLR